MNPERCRLVPLAVVVIPIWALPACAPDIDASADPLVVTEDGAMAYAEPQSPERAAAVAEMRMNAEAGDLLPYPDAFQTEQTLRLAARPEPRAVSEADAIEAELAAIARRQGGATTPQELAAMNARAEELRRLLRATQTGAP